MMFSGRSLLKTVGIYFLTLLLLVIIMFFSMLIPHKWVAENANESVVYSRRSIHDKRVKKDVKEYTVSDDGDLRYSEMVYLVDNKKPVKSMIEMNAYISGYYKDLSKNKYTYREYARYWHGPITYLRFMMIFMNIKNIYKLNKVLIVLLLIFFVIYLFRKDKVLSVSFFLIAIAFSLIHVANNISYFNMIVISIVGSVIAMEMYKKRKDNYDILFALLALFTSFFDFYTIDVLSLTLPLLCLIILSRKDNKEMSIKKIIRYVLIWFGFYMLTFIIKWIIDYFYLGPEVLKDVSRRAKVESYDTKLGLRALQVFDENLKLIVPFYFMKNYIYLLIPIMMAFIYNIIYHVRFKYYKGVYIVILICFVRLLMVSVQSINLTFTTFRILIPVVLFIVYILIKQGINIVIKRH